MKLVSWNVNGIRAAVKKNFINSLDAMDCDVICLQETKAQDEQVTEALSDVKDYYVYVNSAIKKGYSGTAILTKDEPLHVDTDMGIEKHDQEGRVITAEFDSFYLVTVYTPNSGSELKRLDYRQEWDKAFLDHLQQLEKTKPVVACGDFNVAHTAIDLARPKQNYNRSAGYMQEEITGFQNLMDAGYVDSYRHLYPEQIKYSWWSYRAGARAKNIGWRIDYFITSNGISDSIRETDIFNEIMGSDHCPVFLDLDV